MPGAWPPDLKADSSINSVAELGGTKIAVWKGTTTGARLNTIVRQDLPGASVVQVGDASQAMAMLESSTAVECIQTQTVRNTFDAVGTLGGAMLGGLLSGIKSAADRAAPWPPWSAPLAAPT